MVPFSNLSPRVRGWLRPVVRSRLRLVAMALAALPIMFAFELRSRQLRPSVEQARASQWVRTTAFMLEQRFPDGSFPDCGGKAPSCQKLLGWMNAAQAPARARLRVRGGHGQFVVEAQLQTGKWVLERGNAARWEGPEEALEVPGWGELWPFWRG
jgi:hypothetical protein